MANPPLITASTPFRRTSDPRQALLEDGYAFLPGILPAERVLEVRRQMLLCAAVGGWLAPGSDPQDAMAGPVPHDERDSDDYRTVYRPIQALEAFHALGQTPALLEVVEQVLGEPAFCLPFKIARLAFPNSELGPTAPHQDYYYIQGSTDTLTMWIPLGPCPAGTGRLTVLAGSHRLGPLPPIPQENSPTGFWIETRDLGLEWHGGDYQPGDVLMFHSLTVHGAEKNQANRVRLSMDIRFQPVADPISELSLRPHFRTGPWEELYQDWQDQSLQYYWRDLPLNVVPVTSSVDRLRQEARSRLLGTVPA